MTSPASDARSPSMDVKMPLLYSAAAQAGCPQRAFLGAGPRPWPGQRVSIRLAQGQCNLNITIVA